MLRRFMYYFIETFVDEIHDIYVLNEQPLKQITEIEIYKPAVVSVLHSNDIDFDVDFDNIKSNVTHTVIIPKSFYKYIIPTINKLAKHIEDIDEYYDLDFNILLRALSDMLFIKY